MDLEILLLYVLIGCFWAIWLENFTTKYLDDPYNRPWSSSERTIQIAFWPITLLVFLHNFFKDLLR